MIQYDEDKGEGIKVTTPGVNTPNHLLMEMICRETGLQLRHMPYNDTNQALTAMPGGHADLAIVNLSNVYSQMQPGSVKLLGIPAAERYENLKDVPTIIEQGINVSGGTTFDIYGPAGLPQEVTAKLTDVFAKSMESEEFQKL
ncbi:MAG: tripartite tricarboxylate transporter substrate-binding protein [Peptococcaceae bacterium]